MNALRFGSEQRGSVAIMFALAIVPVLLGVGMAVEFAHTNHARVSMQAAADSATLAVATLGGKMSDAAATTLATNYFNANFPPDGDVTLTSIAVVRAPNKVSVVAKGSVKTGLLGIAQASQTNVGVESHASWTTNKIEVALVLDNTGSMNQSGKLAQLKLAAKNLLDTLAKVSPDKGTIRVSLVPFATQVQTGFDDKNPPSWVYFNKAESIATNKQKPVKKKDWSGCVTDRAQPHDTDDAPVVLVTSGGGPGGGGPGEGGPGGGGSTTQPDPATGYLAVECQQASLSAIIPLADDLTAAGPLQTAIDGMTAGGNTNVTIGIVHGLATLSPGGPWTGAADYGTQNLEKYMIVLTDGLNTENRYSTLDSQINQRMTLACNEVKANTPVAKNIRLYTIRVIDGDADLLQNCASSPDMYKDVRSASALTPVFQAIANEIAGVRLTQ